MTDFEIMLLVGLVFGLIVGPLTARSSVRREKIYGGTPAKLLHLLASGMYVATPPTVLTGVVVGVGLKTLFPLALLLIFGSLGVLLIFATFETRARPIANAKLDHGWTAEDARKSGL
ncbi:MAG: hypothetical protein F9K46_12650 [Anaerolineae bacterium]|nr:MAG: hypothetical protein F9K46_12650 [Anaerolineae bacterium]